RFEPKALIYLFQPRLFTRQPAQLPGSQLNSVPNTPLRTLFIAHSQLFLLRYTSFYTNFDPFLPHYRQRHCATLPSAIQMPFLPDNRDSQRNTPAETDVSRVTLRLPSHR